MTDVQDWRDLDLAPGGRSLIEASAGTGKTWTIGVLYLRLLLDQNLTPRQIVVATFTNAAAFELKERLRARIEQAQALVLQEFSQTPDPARTDLAWLHARWDGDAPQRAADATRLALALAELDIAPIGTLHSLCLRILSEHPFAAASAFRTPELVDVAELLAILTDDLWRLLQAEQEPDDPALQALRSHYRALAKAADRDTLRTWLKTLLAPGISVAVPDDAPPPERLDWAELFDELVEQETIFSRTNAKIRTRWRSLAAFLASWDPAADGLVFSQLDDLRTEVNSLSGIKEPSRNDPRVQAAVALTLRLLPMLEAFQYAPRARFFASAQAWAKAELVRRMTRAGQLGFDQLLSAVLAALQPDENGQRALADALFAQWPAALIDEFQDTDPSQYGILDAIYRDSDDAMRGRLLMIGDPKQAIYRFRGGDIHTYERAKATIAESDRLTLMVNFRSSHACVEAVNAFYGAVGKRLGSPASQTPIEHIPVKAAAASTETRLTLDAKPAPALVFHDASDAEGDATDALLSCASLIVELLAPTSDHRLDGQPLRASDICVLVPRNADAERMTDYLRRRNIPTVNRGRSSVFDGETASEVLVVLDAVENVHVPGRLRAALATSLLGVSYQQLRRLDEHSTEWEHWVGIFHQWHRDWQDKGVLHVLASIVAEVAARRLGSADGERVLTDLRHLGELLQAAEETCDGPNALLAWLRAQTDSDTSAEEAAEAQALRLESDAQCAQVMTLHSSKGLEFGWVFLPLMWAHTGKKPDLGLLAQADGSRQLVMDSAGLAKVALEEQDERYRVLYVALTRARFACHLWLPSSACKVKKDPAHEAPLNLCVAAIRTAATSVTGLHVSESWPAVTRKRLAASQESDVERSARKLPAARRGPLPALHSFSSLSRHPHAGIDTGAGPAADESDPTAMDLEDVIPPVEESLAPSGTVSAELEALQEVAGTGFGNAIHAILERRQLGMPVRQQLDLVQHWLAHYAIKPPLVAGTHLDLRVAKRLDAVLDADLDGRGLRLSLLPADALRSEMAFHYVLDGASMARLRDAGRDAGFPQLIPSRDEELLGTMTGSIDLVFQHGGRYHLLDWKSNRLGQGSTLEAYAPSALEAVMDATSYRFQALLYTVALERYLKWRLGTDYVRAQHLGDVWYLFVRAVGLRLPDGTACGVWQHRFDDALLDAMQEGLA